MLLEYSYDKCNMVIDSFNKSNIASLSITKAENGAYVMDYVLVSDLAEPKQVAVRKVLAESLPKRLEVVAILNQFLEAQILNGVTNFSLRFNAIDVRNECELVVSSAYKAMPENNNALLAELEKCLEHYDLLITKLGASDVELKDVFIKPVGRSKKYLPVTMKDFGDSIRKELAKS